MTKLLVLLVELKSAPKVGLMCLFLFVLAASKPAPKVQLKLLVGLGPSSSDLD